MSISGIDGLILQLVYYVNMYVLYSHRHISLILGVIQKSGPKVKKNFFSCSTQLIIQFVMLINDKMPTIVGILTFISMINTTSESLKWRKIFIFQHISYELMKFHAQLLSMKKVL